MKKGLNKKKNAQHTSFKCSKIVKNKNLTDCKGNDFYLNQIIKNTLRFLQKETIKEVKNSYPEEIVFELVLKVNTTTCTAICKAFDIEQKNATRYKRELEKRGLLIELIPRNKKKRCKVTGRIASYLTTNSELVKSNINK